MPPAYDPGVHAATQAATAAAALSRLQAAHATFRGARSPSSVQLPASPHSPTPAAPLPCRRRVSARAIMLTDEARGGGAPSSQRPRTATALGRLSPTRPVERWAGGAAATPATASTLSGGSTCRRSELCAPACSAAAGSSVSTARSRASSGAYSVYAVQQRPADSDAEGHSGRDRIGGPLGSGASQRLREFDATDQASIGGRRPRSSEHRQHRQSAADGLRAPGAAVDHTTSSGVGASYRGCDDRVRSLLLWSVRGGVRTGDQLFVGGPGGRAPRRPSACEQEAARTPDLPVSVRGRII
jgi:hypothetical protein